MVYGQPVVTGAAVVEGDEAGVGVDDATGAVLVGDGHAVDQIAVEGVVVDEEVGALGARDKADGLV